MFNETQLLSELWDTSQKFGKLQTIKMYKLKLTNLIKKRNIGIHKDTLIVGDRDENLKRLVEDVCRVFNLSNKQFLYGGRSLGVVIPRHIYHKVAYDNKIGTLKAIAKFSGGLDHTTVRSSIIRASDLVYVKDERFLNLWDKYLSDGDPYYTDIYFSKVTFTVINNSKKTA